MTMENADFDMVDEILNALTDETDYKFRIYNRKVMVNVHSLLHDAYKYFADEV